MNAKTYQGLSGGIFLIGLCFLFLTHIGFWPWILVVIGLSSLPASLAMKKGWYGWQGTLWMIGLAILFWSGHFWPGILILVGLSALGAPLTRDTSGSPFEGPQPAAPQPQTSGSDTRPLAPMSEDAQEADQAPAQGPSQTAKLDESPTSEDKQE